MTQRWVYQISFLNSSDQVDIGRVTRFQTIAQDFNHRKACAWSRLKNFPFKWVDFILYYIKSAVIFSIKETEIIIQLDHSCLIALGKRNLLYGNTNFVSDCETNSSKPQKTHFKSQGWPLYEVSSITAWCTFQLNQYILYCCCTSQENNKLVNVLSNL